MDDSTFKEIGRFLNDIEHNANSHPDMLAFLFAALALGIQVGTWDQSGGAWKLEDQHQAVSMGDVFIAASMQALRMSSFMSRPTLLTIQALVIMSPYLTNSGRFLDAWTLFGTTIRLAHSIGLHRNPRFLEPAPPLRECATRQTLWWWILHMDQQYSMTLGRPLGISGIGDCPPPEPLTTDPTILRLSEFVDHFTILARQILNSDGLSNLKIDEFTNKLQSLWDTLPEMLQFDEGWIEENRNVPEWPLNVMAAIYSGKIHNYIILLNRQRLENTQRSESPVVSPAALNSPHLNYPFPGGQQSFASQYYTPQQYQSAYQPSYAPHGPQRSRSRRDSHPYPPSHSSHSTNGHSPATTPSSSSPPSAVHPATSATSPIPRGRPLVLHSSTFLLNTILFLSRREPCALIVWGVCQAAFNAGMILILDAIECGRSERTVENLRKVQAAWRVFKGLEEGGVHRLAGLARRRVEEGLGRCREAWSGQQQRQQQEARGAMGGGVVGAEGVMGATGMMLLEDHGLQAFRPEGYAPLRWDMVGGELGRRG
ncbi:MAG: hypothetical protein M1820_007907 [Bogoriella megaspora]|nr:MAG: hypothetical protein M1820_007907 [Bogoriella megaspora]